MKKRLLITILTATMLCSITACSNNGNKNDKEEIDVVATEVSSDNKEANPNKEEEPQPTKVVENVEKSTNINDEEPTTSPTNEEIKDEVTSTPEATETPSTKESVTKVPATETPKAPTTKPVETKEPTTKAPVPTSKPVETEASKHTHNWKAVKATRTIKGYYKDVPITEEITKLEEYHDCEECGYIDLDEVVDLWNKDHKRTMNSPEKIDHLFSHFSNEEIEPYIRKCIKKQGKADLSKHSITECASGFVYDDQLDIIHDEEGYPLKKYVSIPYKTTRTIITTEWVEPKTEEYIDHYECSCGARK